jgi:hypothetical protein
MAQAEIRRSRFAAGNGELALPKSFKGAILAPKSSGSGECQITWFTTKS